MIIDPKTYLKRVKGINFSVPSVDNPLGLSILQRMEDSIKTDLVSPADWKRGSESGLFSPPNKSEYTTYLDFSDLLFDPGWTSYKFMNTWGYPKEKHNTVDEPMEVNLTETLNGFRSWVLVDGVLESLYAHHKKRAKWLPMEPHVASCPDKRCVETPTSDHTCGIYATDKLEQVPKGNDNGEDTVVGLVHGWGRYVRGETGWRAQYAYPKEFRLRENQVDLIDVLKAYQVPIFIQQPLKIYDPEEEGYANGNDKENWNL